MPEAVGKGARFISDNKKYVQNSTNVFRMSACMGFNIPDGMPTVFSDFTILNNTIPTVH